MLLLLLLNWFGSVSSSNSGKFTRDQGLSRGFGDAALFMSQATRQTDGRGADGRMTRTRASTGGVLLESLKHSST